MCVGVTQNGSDKTQKVSLEEQPIIENSPGLPQDAKSLRMEKSFEVYRRNNDGLETLPSASSGTRLASLLWQPSTIHAANDLIESVSIQTTQNRQYVHSRAFTEFHMNYEYELLVVNWIHKKKFIISTKYLSEFKLGML